MMRPRSRPTHTDASTEGATMTTQPVQSPADAEVVRGHLAEIITSIHHGPGDRGISRHTKEVVASTE